MNSSDNYLRIACREKNVHSLGPGSRYCLWVQGCMRRCPGCISPDEQPMDGGYLMSIRAIAAEIALCKPDGVTISGGEPFLQAVALAKMLTFLRDVFTYDTGVIIYTGYKIEDLEKLPGSNLLLSQTDLLIDGEYIQELDDGKSLRGSSNQRIIPLTERYNKPDILGLYGIEGRQTEYFWHGNSVNCVGVADHIRDKDAPLKHFFDDKTNEDRKNKYTEEHF